MTEYSSNPGEGIGVAFDYVTCPYNESHQIQRFKLDTHLAKCSKQHKDLKTKICPFDNKHVVMEGQFDYHVRQCRQSKMLDQVKYNLDPSTDRLPAPIPVPEVQASEDWEDDNAASYDPLEQAARQPNIIRKIKGATPSERRAFRLAQRYECSKNN